MAKKKLKNLSKGETIMVKKNKKNLVIVGALCLTLVLGGIMAYFTAGDSAENVFTVGKVSIDLTEDNWDPDNPPTDITPNQPFDKDPQIDNLGDNNAYAFMRVTIPKANVITDSALTGTQNQAAAMTELFQLNKVASDKNAAHNATTGTQSTVQWTGRAVNNADSVDLDHWVLVASATQASEAAAVGVSTTSTDDNYVDLSKNNVYVFAYGSSQACEAIEAKNGNTIDSTEPLFRSITFANVVENQGLEDAELSVNVDAFAIQTENLKETNTNAPAEVWAIIVNQNPVEPEQQNP